ncbi:hypothetical protein [Sphingobium sp. BHU LFT2]|uniref:hypothetical protein n=1 Tax=Sphingobium sp. BHU LFT2 TaxID=2807634 RepID=UPI001BE9CBA4|nr:hypothetical protein [Sphingobium sp. BHU LFT2]
MNQVTAPISLPLHADEAAAILEALGQANRAGRIGSLETQRRTWVAHRLARLVEQQGAIG